MDVEFFGRCENHAGGWLAKIRFAFVLTNAMLRVIWAPINFSDDRPLACKLLQHPDVQDMEGLLGVITPTDTGLIGNNKKVITLLSGETANVENTFNKVHRLRRMNVAMIDVNDAVTV